MPNTEQSACLDIGNFERDNFATTLSSTVRSRTSDYFYLFFDNSQFPPNVEIYGRNNLPVKTIYCFLIQKICPVFNKTQHLHTS